MCTVFGIFDKEIPKVMNAVILYMVNICHIPFPELEFDENIQL